MKSNKSNKQVQGNQTAITIFVALMLVWLVALTTFSIWSWNIHLWQARVDNDAIYQLMVENAKQQQVLDNLQNN